MDQFYLSACKRFRVAPKGQVLHAFTEMGEISPQGGLTVEAHELQRDDWMAIVQTFEACAQALPTTPGIRALPVSFDFCDSPLDVDVFHKFLSSWMHYVGLIKDPYTIISLSLSLRRCRLSDTHILVFCDCLQQEGKKHYINFDLVCFSDNPSITVLGGLRSLGDVLRAAQQWPLPPALPSPTELDMMDRGSTTPSYYTPEPRSSLFSRGVSGATRSNIIIPPTRLQQASRIPTFQTSTTHTRFQSNKYNEKRKGPPAAGSRQPHRTPSPNKGGSSGRQVISSLILRNCQLRLVLHGDDEYRQDMYNVLVDTVGTLFRQVSSLDLTWSTIFDSVDEMDNSPIPLLDHVCQHFLSLSPTLTQLNLSRCNIGQTRPDGGRILVQVLLQNPTLVKVNLRRNRFRNDVMIGFSEVVAKCTNLEELLLGDCFFSDGVPSASTPLAAHNILDALPRSPSLKVLDITNMPLCSSRSASSAIPALARSLISCAVLKKLHITFPLEGPDLSIAISDFIRVINSAGFVADHAPSGSANCVEVPPAKQGSLHSLLYWLVDDIRTEQLGYYRMELLEGFSEPPELPEPPQPAMSPAMKEERPLDTAVAFKKDKETEYQQTQPRSTEDVTVKEQESAEQRTAEVSTPVSSPPRREATPGPVAEVRQSYASPGVRENGEGKVLALRLQTEINRHQVAMSDISTHWECLNVYTNSLSDFFRTSVWLYHSYHNAKTDLIFASCEEIIRSNHFYLDKRCTLAEREKKQLEHDLILAREKVHTVEGHNETQRNEIFSLKEQILELHEKLSLARIEIERLRPQQGYATSGPQPRPEFLTPTPLRSPVPHKESERSPVSSPPQLEEHEEDTEAARRAKESIEMSETPYVEKRTKSPDDSQKNKRQAEEKENSKNEPQPASSTQEEHSSEQQKQEPSPKHAEGQGEPATATSAPPSEQEKQEPSPKHAEGQEEPATATSPPPSEQQQQEPPPEHAERQEEPATATTAQFEQQQNTEPERTEVEPGKRNGSEATPSRTSSNVPRERQRRRSISAIDDDQQPGKPKAPKEPNTPVDRKPKEEPATATSAPPSEQQKQEPSPKHAERQEEPATATGPPPSEQQKQEPSPKHAERQEEPATATSPPPSEQQKQEPSPKHAERQEEPATATSAPPSEQQKQEPSPKHAERQEEPATATSPPPSEQQKQELSPKHAERQEEPNNKNESEATPSRTSSNVPRERQRRRSISAIDDDQQPGKPKAPKEPNTPVDASPPPEPEQPKKEGERGSRTQSFRKTTPTEQDRSAPTEDISPSTKSRELSSVGTQAKVSPPPQAVAATQSEDPPSKEAEAVVAQTTETQTDVTRPAYAEPLCSTATQSEPEAIIKSEPSPSPSKARSEDKETSTSPHLQESAEPPAEATPTATRADPLDAPANRGEIDSRRSSVAYRQSTTAPHEKSPRSAANVSHTKPVGLGEYRIAYHNCRDLLTPPLCYLSLNFEDTLKRYPRFSATVASLPSRSVANLQDAWRRAHIAFKEVECGGPLSEIADEEMRDLLEGCMEHQLFSQEATRSPTRDRSPAASSTMLGTGRSRSPKRSVDDAQVLAIIAGDIMPHELPALLSVYPRFAQAFLSLSKDEAAAFEHSWKRRYEATGIPTTAHSESEDTEVSETPSTVTERYSELLDVMRACFRNGLFDVKQRGLSPQKRPVSSRSPQASEGSTISATSVNERATALLSQPFPQVCERHPTFVSMLINSICEDGSFDSVKAVLEYVEHHWNAIKPFDPLLYGHVAGILEKRIHMC